MPVHMRIENKRNQNQKPILIKIKKRKSNNRVPRSKSIGVIKDYHILNNHIRYIIEKPYSPAQSNLYFF